MDSQRSSSFRIAPESFLFTILLGLFAALPALSIDISSPTLQLLPQALNTTTMMAGLSLSLFMVGFALGQFCGGPVSDRCGRRPVLVAGLASYTIASLACALALSGIALVIFRCLQGMAAGACSVLSFAIVQDLFVGEAARTKRSYVTVVFAAVPMAAPAIGSLLLAGFGSWRAIYAVLALCGGVLLCVIWAWVPESRRQRPGILVPSVPSVQLWRDRTFIGITVTNALSYGAIFAYIAGAPVVIIGQLGFSPAVFSAVFASTAVALTVGAWTSGRLGRRQLRAQALLGPSLALAAVAAVGLEAAIMAHVPWPVALLPLLLAVMFARGMTAPNLQHLAIERRREGAGAASAALGVSQLVAGALSSAAVAALLPAFGPGAIAIPMALLAILAMLSWRPAS
jgi:DHA1 family bicyclomycin/chloramphenicol resistance-like MFS transporter